MANENGFYALEALDGVGKSTTIDLLKRKGYEVVKTPPESFEPLRKIFNSTDLRIRFLYYLLGVLYAGKMAHELQSENHVFSDRYLLTTVAAHEAMGMSPRWITLCQPLINKIVQPDSTFLLTCSQEERRKRLFARGATALDIQNFAYNDQILKGYENWATKFGYNLQIVDTTNLTPQDVVEALESKLL